MSDREDILKDIKSDIRQLDTKFDTMHEILIRNTTVLEEHEKRSTLSEKRIENLEDKHQDREIQVAKIKGFFIYCGAILSTLATVGAAVHYFLRPLLSKFLGP